MRCKETAKKIPAKNFKIDSNPQKGNHDREPLRERTTEQGNQARLFAEEEGGNPLNFPG